MSRRTTSTRGAFEEMMDGLIATTKLAKESAELVSLPGAKGAAGIVLILLETIRAARANKENLLSLARHACDLHEVVRSEIARAPNQTSSSLDSVVEDFSSRLEGIVTTVQELGNHSRLRRVFFHVTDAEKIVDCQRQLDQAHKIFMTATQIQIREMQGQQKVRADAESERAREDRQRAYEEQKRTAQAQSLLRLQVASARWNEDNLCLDGTRVDLLEEIRKWADDEDSSVKPLYWLAGVAGSGKSTIANQMAHEWRKSDRLGGCFFFSRDIADRKDIKHFCGTIASDLAEWFPDLRQFICESIEASPSVVSRAFKDQFTTLITGPIKRSGRSLIFVIDALDECDLEGRSLVLNALLTDVPKVLPPMKVFLTSRPERDISSKIGTSSNRTELNLHEPWNKSDIRLYIKTQLLTFSSSSPSPSWSGLAPHDAETIAERAGGLFVWASTASKMIKDSVNPRRLVSRLLKDGSVRDLDSLYLEALHTSAIPSDSEERADVTLILHVISTVMEPLSIDAIDELLGVDFTENIVRRLGSVLSFSDSCSEPVRVLHPTFVEFLTSEQRCTDPSLRIDIKNIHTRLFRACLRVLQSLREDMCNVGNRSLLNSEIPGLKEKVSQCFSETFLYACRFWAYHAAGSDVQKGTQVSVLQLLEAHFLHWLEALSLMGRSNEGATALFHLKSSLKSNEWGSPELERWCRDALRFVQVHQNVLQSSASQVYMSALLFTPLSVCIPQQFMLSNNYFPKILKGRDLAWTASLTLKGHSAWVQCVAYSPDGTRIASGSMDNTVRIWDAISGIALGEALEGHISSVDCVTYSPNGIRVASGSKDCTIRVWDASSGSFILGPMRGHTGWVKCLVYSPDGTRIASGSDDRTFRLWDATSGSTLWGPIAGHNDWVMCIAFCQDGTQIASGSMSGTVIIADAATGSPLKPKMKKNNSSVDCLAFLPDESWAAAGSHDEVLYTWNTSSGSDEGQALRGHTHWINSIKFSPDKSRIVSGSQDRTLRIWNTVSGQSIGAPLEGHGGPVFCVDHSPDGTQIASASWDKTVRIWDAMTNSLVDEAVARHTKLVTCLQFSPDSTRIASASFDKTVRLWDALSGSAIGGVLKGIRSWVNCIAFSPDQSRLASGCQDGSVLVWDTLSRSSDGRTLPGGAESVILVRFSRTGFRLAALSIDGTLRIWNPASGTLLNNFVLPPFIEAIHDHQDIGVDSSVDKAPQRKLQELLGTSPPWIPGGSLQAVSFEPRNQIFLDRDGWVYRVDRKERLLYLPLVNRSNSELGLDREPMAMVSGALLVVGTSHGHITIIDCSPMLS